MEESQAGPEGLSDSPLFSHDQVCGGSSEVPGMVLSSELGFHGTVGPGEEAGGSVPKLCGKLCHTETGRSEQGAHH